MSTSFRPRRDFPGLERRRQQAGERFAAGDSQAAVARRLHVSRQSVSRWYQQWKSGGPAALRAAGRAGRKPRLGPAQFGQLDAALRRGARAQGFPTALWTLPRIAEVIRQQTGVRYHPGHVWKLLRAIHCTLQRPARRAQERDEGAIRRWVHTRWPAVKKTPAAGTPG
jgi:transposase